MRTLLKNRLLIPAVLLLALLCALLVWRPWRTGTSPSPVAGTEASVASLPQREVTLYFIAADGRQLVAEVRKIAGCQAEIDCLRGTVEALLDGPEGDLAPLFSSHAVLRSVRSAAGTAEVDLSREALAEHPGGSLSELLSAVGLADTIAANFPQLRGVRILIEGQPVATFKGHVDLRQPVLADFSLVRANAAGQTDAGR